MKSIYFIVGCICLLAFAVMPAQAFTAKALTINLDTNGNAQVDFQYDLSFTEQIAVFANIASPANELKAGLENNLHREVTVVKADSSSAEVIIPSFASVSQSNGTETITTPAFSFANAENAIRQYWWAPLVSVDLSPDVTTISFPDGYQARFLNQISFISLSHQIA
ncbi:hypothetical protein [Methanoregula sp.]|uniref:hypothetical protein n=1 Tax=Methanoregula sp. TaxID=2052170 RepID=UPI0025D90048|nr:hypothetical protein [Methanoregula sp.]